MSASLQVRNISKAFGTTSVLEDVSLDVAPGEFVSLVGSSGCGKSTLLRIIAGLEIQDGGHVAIGDANVDRLSPRARNIAMVFQNYALYPHMSAFDNIALPLTVGRLSLAERLPLIRHLSPRRPRISQQIASEVSAVAAQLRIEPLLARKPGQLSGGQRQRVALARAMVRQPSVFLMDEPLSNLDAQLRVHMRDELADLHARLGATFIYVTHDQTEAMTMSNRVAMMDHGRLAQVGRPRDLYERPATLAVAKFIGSPAINVLPGTVAAGGQVMIFGTPLPLACDLGAGAAVSIGVRPEGVRLTKLELGRLAARVRRVEHHGAERLVFAELQAPASGSIIVRMAGPEDAADVLEAGSGVAVHLDVARLHVFGDAGHRTATRQLPVGSAITHLQGAAASAMS